ncbi:glutathione peroxidase [Cladochytrium replicatum]|nr:glutathione peroxidase [Cladochytrium replicatum]
MSQKISSVYDFKTTTIQNKPFDFADLKGKVILVTNTASHCGFTPQLKSFEALRQKYKDAGLVIVGFPSNSFNMSEAYADSQIEVICQRNHGVTIPMMTLSEVNGSNENALFAFLKEAAPGLFGTKMIKWNFTKFLIDRNGDIVGRFGSTTTPESIEAEVKKLLDA